jgi:hypothetical protein
MWKIQIAICLDKNTVDDNVYKTTLIYAQSKASCLFEKLASFHTLHFINKPLAISLKKHHEL